MLLSKVALISHLVLWSGTAADLTTTIHVPNGVVESNPIVGQNHVRQIAVSGGSAALVEWLIAKHKLSPKFRYIVGGAHWAAAAHNIRTAESVKR